MRVQNCKTEENKARDPFEEIQKKSHMTYEEIKKHNKICYATGEGFPIYGHSEIDRAIKAIVSVVKDNYTKAPDLDARLRHLALNSDSFNISDEEKHIVYELCRNFFNGEWNHAR